MSLSVVIVSACTFLSAPAADTSLAWPEITNQCRPWAYNWWLGSAVDKANLTRELQRYRDGGLGGIHIVPVYGAKGYEDRYIDYLSPQWLEMFAHAAREARRLGLGLDLTTGTGWCFGGPNVPREHAGLSVAFANHALSVRATGPNVKRAAPGGAGPMLNPFYGQAMTNYLERFTQAFPLQSQAERPRAMYHDSYEYNTQWSPDLLVEFQKRRGYRLQDHLPELFGDGKTDSSARVKADYRETASDLMVENVFPRWVRWCHQRNLLTRNQAHGSPGNLLDLYALADIPETEMFSRGSRNPLVSGFDADFGSQGDREPLVSKFASSAAHVAGRKLVAAETGTWMAEHFCETLEEMKCLVDLLLVSGVNHVFYHGTCYSPDEAAWPGWLFYASTEMNPRSAIWRDAPALNLYIARCQAVLQSGRPDNDILLYWPIHDCWQQPGRGLVTGLSVHARGWLNEQPFGKLARQLWNRGYGFDYVSDRQLAQAKASDGRVETPGGVYRAVLLPPAEHIPPATYLRIVTLAEAGATVVFQDRLPTDVPGLADLERRREAIQQITVGIGPLAATSDPKVQEAKIGKGRILVGDAETALALAGIARETLVDHAGTLFVRRAREGGRHYFVANQGQKAIDDWVSLATEASTVAIMDPMTGRAGMGLVREAEGRTEVYLQLPPGGSIVLRTFVGPVASTPAAGTDKPPAPRQVEDLPHNQRQVENLPHARWQYVRLAGEATPISGAWQVKFIQGGPELPKPYETTKLGYWTRCGDPEAERFAGTAVYSIRFDAPGSGGRFLLDLGRVCHSARVRLNGRDLGTLIMAPYRVVLENLQARENLLEAEVTNLSANRIRDLDQRKVVWRKFNDINFVNIGYKPFDASGWPVSDSGLLGPVTLQAVSGVLAPGSPAVGARPASSERSLP